MKHSAANDRGVESNNANRKRDWHRPIATSYERLQGLHFLEQLSCDESPGAVRVCLRGVYQVAEVAFWNMADLIHRGGAAIDRGDADTAISCLTWLSSINHLMVQIGRLPLRLGFAPVGDTTDTIRIHESPAINRLLTAIESFDANAVEKIDVLNLPDSERERLQHLCCVYSHDITIWERDLAAVVVPFRMQDYCEWICADKIHEMVVDLPINEDSFLMQFRCLHQIPEILGSVANGHLLVATEASRSGDPWTAHDNLMVANTLAEIIVASLRPMIDCLSITHYHRIRTYLGVTSGSQSVGLHDRLLRDRYNALCEAVCGQCIEVALDRNEIDAPSSVSIVEAIRLVAEHKADNERVRGFDLVISQILRLHQLLHHWRSAHMHLPRNNLGGGKTRSLIGASNAVSAVQRMREAAERSDPAVAVVKARYVGSTEVPLPLTQYMHSPQSLDSQVLASRGATTREAFPDVQQRTGEFAGQCPAGQCPIAESTTSRKDAGRITK
ncbi:hypothetical protein [Stieleria varia]|nr:hypothetical protein [Stieleria varia]